MDAIVPSFENYVSDDERETEELISKEIEEYSRYSLANKLRIGYFGKDECTQTNATEILQVKDLAEVTETLEKEIMSLKKELELQKTFLRTGYEVKLQQQSVSLSTRINDRMQDLERQHQEKCAMLRKSYRQQLHDAIAVLRGSHKKHYPGNKKDGSELKPQRMRELINELQQKDIIIECLNGQLQECQDGKEVKIMLEPEEDPEKERLGEENKILKKDVDTLQEKIEKMFDTLQNREMQIRDQEKNIQKMKEKIEKDQITINKLTATNERLKMDLEEEKDTARSLLQKQKEDFEEQMQKQLDLCMKNMLSQQEKQVKMVTDLEKEKQDLLNLQRNVKPAIVDEQKVEIDKPENTNDIEQQQRKQMNSLKKQLDLLNRTWEKKFSVLKQSFHAVKNEMYLRQTLERQAATLHSASISYVVDSSGVRHAMKPTEDGSKMAFRYSAPGEPLPNIGSRPVSQNARITRPEIRIPSGKATAEESQIISEDEEEMRGVLSFPSPISSKMHTKKKFKH